MVFTRVLAFVAMGIMYRYVSHRGSNQSIRFLKVSCPIRVGLLKISTGGYGEWQELFAKGMDYLKRCPKIWGHGLVSNFG